jgi:hypothetical protein
MPLRRCSWSLGRPMSYQLPWLGIPGSHIFTRHLDGHRRLLPQAGERLADRNRGDILSGNGSRWYA